MTFCYFTIDPDGTSAVRESKSLEHFLSTERDAAVGPEGADRVRLHPGWMMAGWVGDCSLLPTTGRPRNVVGGILLGVLGAAQQPYAGPVVITGWDDRLTACGQIEVEPLSQVHVMVLQEAVSDIRRVLGMDPGEPKNRDPQWAANVRTFAEYVRNGAVPFMRVVDGAEAEAWLRSQTGRP